MPTPCLLVIDDDSALSQLICTMAANIGYHVHAFHGADVKTGYEKLQPDIVVMDIMMPEIDGFEILSLLRQCESKARIIIISGEESYRDMAARFASGLQLVGNVAKPFQIVPFHAMLSAHYAQIRQENEVGAQARVG
jgi:DNA-binding response OmpR family regulator